MKANKERYILLLVIVALAVKIFFFTDSGEGSLKQKDLEHQKVLDSVAVELDKRDALLELEDKTKQELRDSISIIFAEKKNLQKNYTGLQIYYERINADLANHSITEWDSILSVWYPEPGRRGFYSSMEGRDDGRGHN